MSQNACFHPLVYAEILRALAAGEVRFEVGCVKNRKSLGALARRPPIFNLRMARLALSGMVKSISAVIPGLSIFIGHHHQLLFSLRDFSGSAQVHGWLVAISAMAPPIITPTNIEMVATVPI
jgi:hypothetical protein